MNTQEATVIGTRMSEPEIIAFLGLMPQTYNKELTELAREVCLHRGYFNKSIVRKIKFYRLPASDFQMLTDSKNVLLEIIRTGANWKPDVAFLFLDFKGVETVVNSKYSYGKMNDDLRIKYISEISHLLGSKFQKVNLSN
jgi:hypothetical protein